jgi:hypothetical protein
MLIGKKGNNPGIVYVPYIMQTSTHTIVDSSSFNPRMTMKSRYSTTTVGHGFTMDFWMKNWRRKSRIEKIYKIEKPTEE